MKGLIRCYFHMVRCDIDLWDSDDPISREELLRRVCGLDGLYCLLTEKVDAELLEAAGEYSICVNHESSRLTGSSFNSKWVVEA